MYSEYLRLRSADELVNRLQGENERLKSEVQDLKYRLGNKRGRQEGANKNKGSGNKRGRGGRTGREEKWEGDDKEFLWKEEWCVLECTKKSKHYIWWSTTLYSFCHGH